MRPTIPFRFRQTEQDLRSLRSLLQIALKTAQWTPPEEPFLMTSACGRADEAGLLVGLTAPAGAPCFLFGYDLRAREIEEARKRWLPAAGPRQQLDFRVGDASRLHHLRQLPKFDFILIRHQNFWQAPRTWSEIFQRSLESLKPTGCLVITSYFDREHLLAMASLKQLEATRVADIRNPQSRKLNDAPEKSVDRHLAVYRYSP